MRCQWIVTILSTIASLGLLVIIMGQYEVAIMINKDIKKLQIQSKALDNIYTKDEFLKSLVENLVSQGTKVIEDLEVMMSKLGSEMEAKRTKNADCQVEKAAKADELNVRTKERAKYEAALKAESDAWKKEMVSLEAQLTSYRPVCDYVRKSPIALKLCGTKRAEPPHQKPK